MANADALRRKLIDQASDAVRDATDDILEDLKEDAPYATGETRSMIYAWPVSSAPPRFGFKVTSGSPQGQWVEEGTQPHIIVPVNAKVLHFYIGGNEVFTKQVNHPGTPPRPWFQPIVERWGEYLTRQIN